MTISITEALLFTEVAVSSDSAWMYCYFEVVAQFVHLRSMGLAHLRLMVSDQSKVLVFQGVPKMLEH